MAIRTGSIPQGVAALVPEGPAPAGLPDAAALAQLANQFFRSLPGAPAIDVTNTLPPFEATPPAPVSPASAATTAQGMSPDAVGSARRVSAQAGAPVAPAVPGLTSLVRAPEPVATSYYFLQDAARAAPPSVPSATHASGVHALIVPTLSVELPALPPIGQPTGVPQAAAADVPHYVPVTPPRAQEFYFTGFQRDPPPRAFEDAHPAFDVNAIRRDFPILAERIHGRPLVWFDNAATTQKPQAVIDRLAHFYAHENSNIHRAAHTLAARATDAYEAARQTVAGFLGAGSAENIVFVRGATEAINLVAQSWGTRHIGAGDEIVISHLEHHANIVPWQQLASAAGARLRVAPVDDRGEFLLEEYAKLLNPRTKLVAITHVSNALGTVTPAREIVELAHRAGALALIDGAQSVSHMPVDVQALGADFYVFSGHKVFGPTGIGALYATRDALESMPPWQTGGNMIVDVTLERSVFQPPPARFEAGTGNIADAAGLGSALDYLQRIGLANVAAYEHQLLEYATACLDNVPGLKVIGRAREKASVLSFVLDGHSPEDVGRALDQEGIAVRSGHHCAQPILRRLGYEATVRASLAFYNTDEEVRTMAKVLHQLASSRG